MGFSPLAPFRSLIWKNSPPKSCAEKQESDRLQCKKEAVVGGVWLGGTEVGLVIPNQSESNQIQLAASEETFHVMSHGRVGVEPPEVSFTGTLSLS